MKKVFIPFLKAFSAVAAAVLIISACSCGQRGNENQDIGGVSSAQETARTYEEEISLMGGIIIGGETEYKVIRGELAEKDDVNSAVTLRKAFNSVLASELAIDDDFWNHEKAPVSTDKPEIVVGRTNRAETAELLEDIGKTGYAVRIMNGKLVLAGTDNGCLMMCVKRFIKDVVSNPERIRDGKVTVLPEDCFTVREYTPVQYSQIIEENLGYSVVMTKWISCPAYQDMYVAQGAATDGKYAYFLLRSKDELRSVICKYDMDTREKVAVSEPFYAGHGNDMTYDSARGQLFVVHGQSEGLILTVVDAGTLEVKTLKFVIDYGAGAITYSQKRNAFCVSQGGSTLHYLDSDFKRTLYKDRPRSKNYTPQGMGSDEDYVFFPMSGAKDNILEVYDWEGNSAGTVKINMSEESESMFWTGGSYYVNFYAGRNGAVLYKLDFIPY